MSHRLLIGTPAYTGHTWVGYTAALAESMLHLAAHGVHARVEFKRHTILPIARNQLVLDALEGGYSHLLMIDADMAWPAPAPLRMLAWGRDLVGGCCEQRQGGGIGMDHPRPDPDGSGLLETNSVGGGFMLLSRHCLEQMNAAHPGRAFEFMHAPEVKLAPVGHPYDVQGEDVTYCRRWVKLGGRCYADPGIRLSHLGERVYDATLDEAIERHKRLRAS